MFCKEKSSILKIVLFLRESVLYHVFAVKCNKAVASCIRFIVEKLFLKIVPLNVLCKEMWKFGGKLLYVGTIVIINDLEAMVDGCRDYGGGVVRIVGMICNRLYKFDDYMTKKPVLHAIQNGFAYMVPFVLLGSIALILLSLPIDAYQDFMTRLFGDEWGNILSYVRDGTFNCFSLILVISISYSYTQESNSHQDFMLPIMASITALGSYIALLGVNRSCFSISYFGVVGIFNALIVSLVSAILFRKLSRVKVFRVRTLFDGANPSFSNAISLFIPASLTIFVFAGINEALHHFVGIDNLQAVVASGLSGLFAHVQSVFWKGIVFILFIHVYWFFGIHGSNMLETVARDIFVPALQVNQQLVSSGLAPTAIFTKTFFDSFVLMGGCGSIVCLVLAIVIVGRNKSQLRLAKIAVVPVLFNINELMVFGVPIVLNPIYLIPFVCVPLILTTVSFFFTHIGIVPYTTNMVEWTTPIFLSGYIATGSVWGSVLQLLNLMLGTICYIPFVKLSARSYEAKRDLNLKKIYEAFKYFEEHGAVTSLISRPDTVGSIARSLSADFEYDLRKGAVDLHYQPIVDNNGKVVSIEALLRWNHKGYGFIYPPLVVALAEEAGLIDDLGNLIFEKACKALQKIKGIGIEDVTVCVNVSALQLENDNFMQSLNQIIADSEICPRDIEIEITERLALSNSLRITRQIEEIGKCGIKLAMDDFGAGHSSLMYLKEYNFHTIKLDGSLVREIVSSANCRNIVSSIISLGKAFDCRIVAEFVEEPEQREILQELGSGRELYQGYLFSKALPLEELLVYIQKTNETQEESEAR